MTRQQAPAPDMDNRIADVIWYSLYTNTAANGLRMYIVPVYVPAVQLTHVPLRVQIVAVQQTSRVALLE